MAVAKINGQVVAPVVEKQVPKTKFGVSIDSFLGNVDENGTYQAPQDSFVLDLTGVKDLGDEAFTYAFYYNQHISDILAPDLERVSGLRPMFHSFSYTRGPSLLAFSKLTELSGDEALYSAFSYCTSLNSVDLSALTTISGSDACTYAFTYCTSLNSVDLSALTTISGPYPLAGTFSGCSSLTEISFPKLTNISLLGRSYNSVFSGCTALKNVYFGGVTPGTFATTTNQFQYLFNSRVTGCTVHWPSNMEEIIPTLTGYPNWGGTDTINVYDLPSTEA